MTSTINRVFVDTNLFIYARDDRFPEKRGIAASWLSAIAVREVAVVSPQVLGEFHNVVLKGRIQLSDEDFRATIGLMESWSVGETDIALIVQAWSLRRRTGFQWWDCVILASAIRAECRHLLSEDYQHGRTVDGVTIVSPFRLSPIDLFSPH